MLVPIYKLVTPKLEVVSPVWLKGIILHEEEVNHQRLAAKLHSILSSILVFVGRTVFTHNRDLRTHLLFSKLIRNLGGQTDGQSKLNYISCRYSNFLFMLLMFPHPLGRDVPYLLGNFKYE